MAINSNGLTLAELQEVVVFEEALHFVNPFESRFFHLLLHDFLAGAHVTQGPVRTDPFNAFEVDQADDPFGTQGRSESTSSWTAETRSDDTYRR